MADFHDGAVTRACFYYLPAQAMIMSVTPITSVSKTNQKE